MRFLVLTATLAVAGCTSLVPGTLRDLAGTSPLTVDPQEISAAIELPMGVAIADGGANLFLGAKRSDTGQEIGRNFLLIADSETDNGRVIFAIAPADIPEVQKLQTEISEWKSAAPDATEGTLSVSITACRVGDGPQPNATVSVYISMDNEGSFRPLVQAAPIASVLADADDIGACA